MILFLGYHEGYQQSYPQQQFQQPRQQGYQQSYQGSQGSVPRGPNPTYGGQGGTSRGPNPRKGGTVRATSDSKPDVRGFEICNSRHFKPGHVFKVLWSEPMGQSTSGQTDVTTDEVEDSTGGTVYTTIRRFIIVASGKGHSSCV